ncbi:MAG: hypothetical protein H6738_18080 [Alphaproteobacteria bacterium]|nr:hypothetical protein [Alphaproteobacteria bacterium]
MPPRPLLLVGLCATGCKVIDAPEDLEDLAVFAFRTFADDDPAFPTTAVDGLQPVLTTNAEELAAGYRVTELTEADLEAVGLTSTIDDGITGMAATASYDSDADDIAAAWTNPHMDEVIASTLAYELISEDGDRDCFLDHACERYAVQARRVNDMSLFGTSEQVFTRELRWAWSETLERELLTARDLAPDPSTMSSDFVAVDQQYSYSLFLPEESGTLRFDTFWLEVRVIGLDIPDTFALDMSISMMGNTADQVDAWVAARGR